MSDIDCLWRKLQDSGSNSLLRKHLSSDLYRKCKGLKTKFGGTLADCIRSGCENPDSGVGIYACDPDAYTVFSSVLDSVIKEYHHVDKLDHPKECDFGYDRPDFGDLDSTGQMIISTRVIVSRSLDSHGFPPFLKKEDRKDIELQTKGALNTLEGDLKGTYYPLIGMTQETQTQLTEDYSLFNDSDKFLRAASSDDDWPIGRGIFHNKDKTFLAWVNEEDHMRFISMQKGGDLREVYQRLVRAVRHLERRLSFARRDGLGYLTFYPSNLGTALRASVRIKIPRLAAQADFQAFCDKLNIKARGIHGEHTESVDGMYDVSNARCLGLTEYQAIMETKNGVEAVIAREKELHGSG